MIVYEATKSEFMRQVDNDEISIAIEKVYREKIGKANDGEKRAWRNSMLYMYKALNVPEIPEDCFIAIEYRIPATSMRIDFIITGLDRENREHAVIVELKQWDQVEEVSDEDGIVKTILNGGMRRTTHPSYQAWVYSCAIADYNEAVEKNKIAIHPCAYLHNYIRFEDDPLTADVYSEYLEKAPAFTQGEVSELREFIGKYVTKGDRGKVLYSIEGGKIKPSKSLQDALALMLDGNEEFKLIDDQKVIYEKIKKAVRKKIGVGEKTVFIIEGGPGTGKSVLAINLLVNINKLGFSSHYVSKNAAPREVYSKKLKGRYTQKYIGNLFKGSGSYYNSDENEIDVLIVDEAHRLNEKSGMFKNLGENQIKEIINTSKISVFFIDEAQKVTLSDVGSVGEIEKYAKEASAKVIREKLTAQFRCNGADGYLNWLDDVLEIRETGNFDGFDFDYDIEVVDDPSAMRDMIFEKNKKNNKARLVAGYCFNWVSKNNANVDDIVFPQYDFSMKWNLNSTEPWAIGKKSVNEVGCIHTSQGLEFDYVGVIVGDDIRYRDGKIVTDFTKRANTDKSLNGIKGLAKKNPSLAAERADEIIKNTYRVLMTRGMKGCYIYCMDEALQNYLKDRIKMLKENYDHKGIEEKYLTHKELL